MTAPRIQQGELAYWLGVIASAGQQPGAADEIPPHIAQALQILRCVETNEHGALRITDKGRLALRMADPAAIHVQ